MAQSPTKYDFDQEFTEKLVALMLRDATFAEASQGLIKSDYIDNDALSFLTEIVLRYFDKYRVTPSSAVVVQEIRDSIKTNRLSGSRLNEVVEAYKKIKDVDLSDRDYVLAQVVDFAKHTEMRNAIMESIDLLQKDKYDEIEKRIRDALMVGSDESKQYDYFAESERRAEVRKEKQAGNIQKTGVTTGQVEIDNRLFHGGYGREELSVWMAPAKGGKSFALAYSAAAAVLSGNNVLYVTLENSLEVTANRIDAFYSALPINQLQLNADAVHSKIEQLRNTGSMGRFMIEEFPMGTWSPRDADRLIQKHKANGLIFDEMIVDYLDIMCPNNRTGESIEDSKSIWMAMRALAQREKLALVTATQTNREGFRATVAGATHVADDINKIRIADLVMSINRSEEESKGDEARIFFAACRNQEDSLSFRVKQDLSRARFIAEVLEIS